MEHKWSTRVSECLRLATKDPPIPERSAVKKASSFGGEIRMRGAVHAIGSKCWFAGEGIE